MKIINIVLVLSLVFVMNGYVIVVKKEEKKLEIFVEMIKDKSEYVGIFIFY